MLTRIAQIIWYHKVYLNGHLFAVKNLLKVILFTKPNSNYAMMNLDFKRKDSSL